MKLKVTDKKGNQYIAHNVKPFSKRTKANDSEELSADEILNRLFKVNDEEVKETVEAEVNDDVEEVKVEDVEKKEDEVVEEEVTEEPVEEEKVEETDSEDALAALKNLSKDELEQFAKLIPDMIKLMPELVKFFEKAKEEDEEKEEKAEEEKVTEEVDEESDEEEIEEEDIDADEDEDEDDEDEEFLDEVEEEIVDTEDEEDEDVITEDDEEDEEPKKKGHDSKRSFGSIEAKDSRSNADSELEDEIANVWAKRYNQ